MPEIFSYPFFQRALAAALLASISCGIIGTYIVSRRIVFFGGAISHTSFGGIGIGHYMGFDPMLGAAVFSLGAALAIENLSRTSRIRIDSLIGIMWSLGMAVGIIFVFITPGYAPNLMGYLFGSILTVSLFDLIIMLVITLFICATVIVYFREILYIAFDEEFASTKGIAVRFFNYLMMGIVALGIVINIRIVGIILVISLLTIPQVTAGLLTRDFRNIMILSILFALCSSMAGLAASYFLEIPSGAAIIFSAVIVFVLLKTGRDIITRKKLSRNLAASRSGT